MDNPFMASIGGLIESSTRANLEREFGALLPPSTERLMADVGFFDEDRWQKKQIRQMRGGASLVSLLAQHWASFRGAHA
jgi:hypothetical protein